MSTNSTLMSKFWLISILPIPITNTENQLTSEFHKSVVKLMAVTLLFKIP